MVMREWESEGVVEGGVGEEAGSRRVGVVTWYQWAEHPLDYRNTCKDRSSNFIVGGGLLWPHP